MPKRPALAGTGMFAKPTPAPAEIEATALPLTKGSGSRADKKTVPFWIPVPAKRQLKGMVFEMETTEQALLTEALNDLFKKYDKPPIA